MKELENKELLNIEGGAFSLTAAFLNAAARALSTFMDIGKSLGSSIRRAFNGSICPL